MRVIYEKPILDKIIEAIHEADTYNMVIEKIVLTKDEARRLKSESYGLPFPGTLDWKPAEQAVIAVVFGAQVETEE